MRLCIGYTKRWSHIRCVMRSLSTSGMVRFTKACVGLKVVLLGTSAPIETTHNHLRRALHKVIASAEILH